MGIADAASALAAAVGVPAVADRILAVAGAALGGSGVVFALDDGGALLAADGVPHGLARAALLRGRLAAAADGGPVKVIAPVRDDAALGPLGRHAEVGVVSALRAAGVVRGLVVTLLDELPTDEALAAWSAQLPLASLALANAVLTARADASDQQVASVVTAVPDPLLVVGLGGEIRAMNPAAGEVLGLNPAFDVGVQAAARLRSPELVALLGSADGGTADVVIAGSEPRTLLARVVPIRRSDGSESGRVLTLEDVTARREAEQVKADLVAVIGHELRTPLTMIRGYSSTLAKRGDDLQPPARQKALEALHDQTGRLQRLIEDLLLVAGVERERPKLHLVEADVREVVRRACGRAMDLNPTHRLVFDLPERPHVMNVDDVKVQQVLHHLVENACKFSDEGSTVTVGVGRRDDGGCVIEVRDEGIGIFSGDQAGLFERFRQVDGSATRRHGGTGIGLYICRTLVEAHGGRIGLRSALGRGSTFWFDLPPDGPEEDQAS